MNKKITISSVINGNMLKNFFLYIFDSGELIYSKFINNFFGDFTGKIGKAYNAIIKCEFGKFQATFLIVQNYSKTYFLFFNTLYNNNRTNITIKLYEDIIDMPIEKGEIILWQNHTRLQ